MHDEGSDGVSSIYDGESRWLLHRMETSSLLAPNASIAKKCCAAAESTEMPAVPANELEIANCCVKTVVLD